MSIHDGHRERTKAEFMARPDSFPDHKLIEVLLFYTIPRKDTNPIAHLLIERFGSFSGVLDASREELLKVEGVGENTVILFKALRESAKRYLTSRTDTNDIIRTTQQAFNIVRPYFFGLREERVYILCMDGKNRLLGVRKVSKGSVNAVEFTFRQAVENALSLNAEKVILAHNHTSGVALPSPEDIDTTSRLRQVLSTVGVTLEDHLILTDDDFVSFQKSGLMAALDSDPTDKR